MLVSRIENFDQYKEYQGRNGSLFLKNREIEKRLVPEHAKKFTVNGFSYPAKKTVDFQVDYLYSNGSSVNWRERLVCPVTGLNNRLRGAIHMAEFELGLKPYHSVYITEQLTPLYAYLKQRIDNLTGSEFLNAELQSGFINEAGVRHEDMTKLSFNNEQTEFILCYETLEHIPNYMAAFSEAFRVLVKGGALLWTVPFIALNYENTIRAQLGSDGKIVHLLEPEYHGDPVKKGGILCFTHFGWEMLDQVRQVGFKKVYAILYWSRTFGYLGGDQIFFVAIK